MKKIIVALLSLTLLVGTVIPVSAAESSLATAKDGDVVYSFNFNGDSKWQPKGVKAFGENYEAKASADGKSITIKSKAGGKDSKSIWGAPVEGLTYAKTDVHNKYAFVYKIKANNTAAKNYISVGGMTSYWSDDYYEEKGNYGKYTTDGSAEFAINVNELIIWKDNPTVGTTGFVQASKLKKEMDVDSEGFLTMMTVYEGAADKYHNYVLVKGGDPTKEADWIYVQWANLGLKAQNHLGFYIFVNSTEVDVTIKDARIYKGLGYPKTETYKGATTGTSTGGASTGSSSSSGSSTSSSSGSAQTGDNMYLLLPVMFAAVVVLAGSMVVVGKTKRR